MKKAYKYLLFLVLVLLLCGCKDKTSKNTSKVTTNKTTTNKTSTADINKDIVIINTADVHCGVDASSNSCGYTGISAYKKEMIENGNYVSLVDSGDFMQGGLIGAISKGEYIVDILNYLDYDAVTLGNHDFDYGLDIVRKMTNDFNNTVLSCNVSYTGHDESGVRYVQPYTLEEYGNITIGYVGITTPETLVSSNPKNFKENGEIVYDFKGNSATEFYSCIQDTIDECKEEGADYIILLSHTGNNDENKPFTTNEIIEHTSGYIAVMDAHTHDKIGWKTLKDKDNNDVLYCEAGTKLNCFATLTITKNGEIKTDFVEDYNKHDEVFDEYLETINAKVDELKKKVLATIDISLYDDDDHGSINGVRLVRNRETALGNMVADAYRIMMNADIGFINGGGIRDDLIAGEVTYGDIQAVHPFGNGVVTKRVKGIEILDYLEFNSRATQSIYKDAEGNKVGESGGFVNVSGLKYTIDTSITSTVVVENGNFVRVEGARRVKEVYVLVEGVYVDIDPNDYYVVASIDYILVSGGDGNNMFLEDDLIPNEQYLDYEVVIDYIVNELHGSLASKYSSIEGRITIGTDED